MSTKISVIIPVYNAEKYITQCIESLLNQTLRECEFIFINDGSTDKSKQIIEKYQKLDDRIKLLSQENQGVSIARNEGLRVANGEYIGFVDADDFIAKTMYETLYTTATRNDCDVIVSNFESEIEGHKTITKYSFPINVTLNKDYINHEILPYFLKEDNLNTGWNKIYKSKVIRENKVEFPEKVPLGEDGLFNMSFFSFADNMKYIDYTGYFYREVEGSATRNIVGKDYFNRAIEVYNMKLPALYKDLLEEKEIHKLRSIKLIKSVMSYIHVYFTSSNELGFSERFRYIETMISNKEVRKALLVCYGELNGTAGRYEKCILNLIKIKSTIGLYCVTAYSRFRNT
ncbi:glycosyltransferase [Metabacillus halosaccharovorans]|uniref:glycosyltransferase n=1 Tax=Metabacillus halosaccharovorans TaxID=930124 RepID=UPI001C1FB740|nr:glycosyltransferase [Metabacillus halosaccharovorans]MBU7593519.1 glycosyltransferase [Metabacillus halosaccharovorans]